MKYVFTIRLIVVSQIIIHDEILDSLLFFTLGLLLRLHCHSKIRIRRQLNRSSLERKVYQYIFTKPVSRELSLRTCCRFPFLVSIEKAIVFGGVVVPSLGLSSAAIDVSRAARLIGKGTLNTGFRSVFRESCPSAIILASSRSKSASASGSCSSSGRVTTIASSSKSESGLCATSFSKP